MMFTGNSDVSLAGPPIDPSVIPELWRAKASDYWRLLEQANGLELRGGLFRIFGLGTGAAVRDGLAWNARGWRKAYRLPQSIVLWGENIFGDQFGVDMGSQSLVIVACEGGQITTIPQKSLSEYVEAVLLGDPKTCIEVDLVEAAAESGLRPSICEHLSFVLPLMCGGSAEVDNLEVMDAEGHLDLLGQILEQQSGVPEGTAIRGFRDE